MRDFSGDNHTKGFPTIISAIISPSFLYDRMSRETLEIPGEPESRDPPWKRTGDGQVDSIYPWLKILIKLSHDPNFSEVHAGFFA